MVASIRNINRKNQYPLRSSADLDPLLTAIGDARYVLLGEATHGTHEYYTWRTAVSKRLIQEKGFSFIAVEGDWPDCYRINRFVKGYADAGESAADVLKSFRRWPTWMWANWEIAALMEWMREYNRNRPVHEKVGFYGLDVYSLWESMEVIVHYLRREDPQAARYAMEAIRCFEPYKEEQHYARAMLTLSTHCANEVVKLLQVVRKRSRNYDHDPEAALNAEMNAQVIANAEHYYRAMISFQHESWNIRDSHMVAALDSIMRFYGRRAKGIVWEHNTHVGDARYTDMKDQGMWNVGQLVREKHRESSGVYIAGFASWAGTVMAGSAWGGVMEKMTIPPAPEGTLEYILHEDSAEDKLILLNNEYWNKRFHDYIGHRAIGVVYQPQYDRAQFVPTILPSRYDALLYLDRTRALHPLYFEPDGVQLPETYPFGV